MDWKRASAHVLALIPLVVAGCSTTGFHHSPTPTSSQQSWAGASTRSLPAGKDLSLHVRTAMEEVGVHSIGETQRSPDITIYEGRTADGKRATVNVARQGAEAAVSARFGLFGDPSLNHAFFDRLALMEKPDAAKDASVGRAAATKIEGEDDEDRPRRKRTRIAREGVPDSVMLRDRADEGYRDTPIP